MKIKNWHKFQHFKDRKPPWIKLYKDLLDNPDWFSLKDKDARLLVHLWLLASEDKTLTGTLPSIRTIAFRLRTTEREISKGLQALGDWLYQDDTELISSRYQDDAPETETETKTETETETKCPSQKIADLFNSTCKTLPSVKVLTDKRKKTISIRWKEDKGRQTLSWWQDYFKMVDNSSFLRGDKTDFNASFDWLLGPSNMVKVLEGNYEDKKTPQEKQTCNTCLNFCIASSPDKCHKSATRNACHEFKPR